MNLTEREKIVLRFLDEGRMERTASQIGHELARFGLCKGGYIAVGSSTAARMRKRGLVMRLPDLNAWRITKDGRAALIHQQGTAQSEPRHEGEDLCPPQDQ